MSSPTLTLPERAALIDLAAGPLRLATRWQDGERLVFYSRQAPPAGEHDGAVLIDLGLLGFVEPGGNHDNFKITPAGRAAIEAWLRLARAL